MKARIGFALCGAFGAMGQAFEAAKALVVQGYELTPIFSETAAALSTRYGRGSGHILLFETLCGRKAIRDLAAAEELQPFDLLVIAPCTGTTLAKLSHGMIDSAVTMAAKRQRCAGSPTLIAVHTEDAFGTAGKNIALQLSRTGVHFVPIRRTLGEVPRLEAAFDAIPNTVERVLAGESIRPVYQ